MKEDESYFTPPELAKRLVSLLRKHIEVPVQKGKRTQLAVLEPSAGMGAFLAPLDNVGYIHAVEPNHPLRMSSENGYIHKLHEKRLEDFADENEVEFDVVCGNPPFSKAEAHLRLCFDMTKPGGTVGMLLRIGFLASKKRKALFAEFPPHTIYVLSERPSFVWSWKCMKCNHKWTTDTGVETKKKKCPKCAAKSADIRVVKTDQYDYAFFVWRVGERPDTVLKWL